MGEYIDIIKQHGWTAIGILTLLGAFIEITPIKINPLSWLGKWVIRGIKWLGKQMNSELSTEIKESQQSFSDHIEKSEGKFANIEKIGDERRIKDLRWQILDFGNSVKTSTYHKDAFDHIYEVHEEYESLLEKYGKKNGQVTRAMKVITSVYDQRFEDPDF